MSERRNHALELLLSRLLQQIHDTSHGREPSADVDRLLFELRQDPTVVEERAWGLRRRVERFAERSAELRTHAHKIEQEHERLEARP